MKVFGFIGVVGLEAKPEPVEVRAKDSIRQARCSVFGILSH